MKDIIRLVGMSFYGYHGTTAAERETGRVFEVDCELGVDLAEAGHSDQLADTIDYAQVYGTVRDLIEGKAYSLLETLASEVAAQILNGFPAYRVTVRVRKMSPPVTGHMRCIEVELTRHQADTSKLVNDTQA